MPLPAYEDFGILQFPLYLRMIKGPTHWSPTDMTRSSAVFRDQRTEGGLFSVYQVRNIFDIYAFITAIDASKRGSGDEFHFILIRNTELEQCGVTYQHSSDSERIRCMAAQKLHYNAIADEEARMRLATLLHGRNRQSRKVMKTHIEEIRSHMGTFGCISHGQSNPNGNCSKCNLTLFQKLKIFLLRQ